MIALILDGVFDDRDYEGKTKIGFTDWCCFCKDSEYQADLWALGMHVGFVPTTPLVPCCDICLYLWRCFKSRENMKRYIKDENEFRFYGRPKSLYWTKSGLEYVRKKVIEEEKKREAVFRM